ncbi:cytosine/adenosine deaminase [Candidatus Symbiobacter mobilis CR]|uniref:tRNA-specific adenosine deaminase n=2 Tax=Candidatus Symbiobacter TaxID=1436289 RepID=U5N6Z5_9BURK|nr:cytosine/adenosine deaminase [Candidatus Symbiobacter mobilis CR]
MILPDEEAMLHALAQARLAAQLGEVPVGAVIVRGGEVLAAAHNEVLQKNDPTAHAEMLALRRAAAAVGNCRLDGCTLVCTLEPCAMCVGALVHARVGRLVYGAREPKTGAVRSQMQLLAHPAMPNPPVVMEGVLAADSAKLLQDFFVQRRAVSRSQRWPLRDDALRTPEERFACVASPYVSRYVADLPSLAGLRMHYWCEGAQTATVAPAMLTLHGPQEWSAAWIEWMDRDLTAGRRVLLPDRIGYGRSDKPKKESAHSLRWHAAIALELLDRLGIGSVEIRTSLAGMPVAEALAMLAGERVVAIHPATPSLLSEAVREAPYPDRGHRAALRAAQRGRA